MDAAGSDRAALFGISEGGPMSVLFAATHPDRVTALVLHGAMGRTTEAPDYPWASPAEALRESVAEFIAPYWGQHAAGMVELFAPSFADDPQAAEFTARMERSAASPAMVQQIFEMFLDIDVRAILPTIHVPTLVLHRRGDRVVNRRAGKALAAQIPRARYAELPGIGAGPRVNDTLRRIARTFTLAVLSVTGSIGGARSPELNVIVSPSSDRLPPRLPLATSWRPRGARWRCRGHLGVPRACRRTSRPGSASTIVNARPTRSSSLSRI